MADKKISALPAASTPLAGSEVLPIVQSGTTVKVSVANLTAGRTTAMSLLDVENSAGGGVLGTFKSNWSNTRVAVEGDGATGAGVLNISNVAASAPLPFKIKMNGTEVVDLSTGGNLKATTGNFVVGTAGRGIDFSANTNAPGMTSELLNWYEEGTWTPTLQGGSTAGSYTVATTTAQYTRVGRMVTVTAGMAITVNSAGTGVARFGGLPFTKGANQFLNGSVSTSAVSYGANVISVNVQAWTSGASTDFALLGVRSGTAPYDVAITDFVTGSVVYVTFTYFV